MWLRALTVLGLILQTRALHFYIQANEERCFLEELPSDTIVEAHYKALEWVEESQSWAVNEAMGIQIHVEEVATGDRVLNVVGKPDGKFTFTSHEPGDHSICLQTNSSSGWFSTTHVKFYLDVAVGSSRHDPDHDSSHIATVTTKLRDLNEKVESIKLEQKYQREIEATFRDSSETTNSRAVYWILMQMVVLIVTAWWQTRYLKGFFADKKLR